MNDKLKKINECFEVFDYKTTFQYLLEMYKAEKILNKTLILVVGANGSGKSTLIANLFSKQGFIVNYINADIVAKNVFAHIEDEEERNYSSMYFTMDMVDSYINEGYMFCYETVLSHISKLDIVKKAKEKGYKIITIYLYTNSPEINLHRVKMRANQGGHDVPADKILSRYARVVDNVEKLKKLSNEFYIFDNSNELQIVS
ncbi:MAG: zeta toxin family protein [Clostridia bacterium]|nr:zeta toxin family protein [Clostridia bacterium]